MSNPIYDAIKSRTGFDRWPEPGAGTEFAYVIGFTPEWNGIPSHLGSEMLRGLPPEGGGSVLRFMLLGGNKADSRVMVDINETLSGIQAREMLIAQMSRSMNPNILERLDLAGLGEIALADEGARAGIIYFVRYNLAFRVVHESGDEMDPTEVARSLDQQLLVLGTAPPGGQPRPVIPRFEFDSGSVEEGALVGLTFSYQDEGDDVITAVVRTGAGPIHQDRDGRMFIDALRPGSHSVSVTIESNEGRIGRVEKTLEVTTNL